MHATIFGNVVSIVGRMYGRRAEYDKKVETQYWVDPTWPSPGPRLGILCKASQVAKRCSPKVSFLIINELEQENQFGIHKTRVFKAFEPCQFLLPSSIITQDGWPPSDKVVLQSWPGQQGGVGEGWWQILDPGGVSGRPPGRDILPPLQGTTWSTTFWLSLLQLQVHLQDGQKIK